MNKKLNYGDTYAHLLTKFSRIMRLMILMLILGMNSLLAASAYSQLTKITLKMSDSRIEEVLNQIESKSEFYFLFDQKQIDINRKVSINVEDEKIAAILDELFAGTEVKHVVIDRQIVLTTSFVTENPGQQQGKQVAGKVTDSSGAPLPGVSVVVKSTTTGVISDANGAYSLSNIPENATLQFSFVGMKTQEVAVGSKSIVNVTLAEDAIGLEEVVAVGYGTQKKVNLTGSVQSISSNELSRRSTPNASVALQGLVPGLTVVQSSGQPGADGASLTVRGIGSINSSTSPLVLIDGIQGDMNQIDINAIESISVLKDAASASIYGSRASNGVILITTKRSTVEKMSITYNGYTGINTPTELPAPVSGIEYMEAINTARGNSNMAPQYSQDLITQYKTVGADNFNRYNTNWKDELIKKSAFVQNHSISLSGGSKQINYFANAGYYSQDGQIPNNNYNRKTLRINTDARITNWLKLGLDINIRQSEIKRPTQQDAAEIVSYAITNVPVFSGVNNDGTWGYGQNGLNPIAIAKNGGISNSITPELGIKGFLQLNPFDGFDAKISYSSRKIENDENSFTKQYDTYESGIFMGTFPASGQKKNESWFQERLNQFNMQASYEKNIAKSYLKVLLGMQTDEQLNHSFNATRQGYVIPDFEELTNGNPSTATNDSNSSEWSMLSYFGRINYSFNNRYLLEVNTRWDASSRFMKDVRWGFFPSASVGWRISEEPFFKTVKSSIDNFKLRASYGTLGNQDIGDYYPYAASLMTGSDYQFNKTLNGGVAQRQMSNGKITWETSTQTNVGLDLGMFSSRLDLTFDYYVRNIDNMLQQLPIPVYVGLSSSWENAGSMCNKGWDLSVSWRDKVGKVAYSVTGILSDVKNKVTNLYGKEYISSTSITRDGLPINSWYGYVSDGYFQSKEEIEKSPVYGGNKLNVQPGYIRYKDISGSGGIPDRIINDKDRTIIGDPFPRYQFGLSLKAEYKGFDISLLFQGVGKKNILLTGSGARPFFIGRTIFKNQLDTWSPDNTDAKFPLLLIDGSGTNPNNIVSDFWIKNGAYLRVKNVEIGYTLSSKVLEKVKINHVRLYLSGQNLFTISNAYKGYDPENRVDGGNFYPVMRTYSFGVDLNF